MVKEPTEIIENIEKMHVVLQDLSKTIRSQNSKLESQLKSINDKIESLLKYDQLLKDHEQNPY